MFLLSLNLFHGFFQQKRYTSYRHGISDIQNNLFTRIRTCAELMLYSSLFLGLAAVGMGFTSCFVQGIPFAGPIGLVMFLMVFSVYNLNRKTDEAEDALNHECRFRVTKKYEHHLFGAAIVAYLVALAIAAWYGVAAFCVVMVPLVSGLLYSVPVLPGWCEYRRLKEIPVMKNLVVSSSWAFAFSLAPVYLGASSPVPDPLLYSCSYSAGRLLPRSPTSGTGEEILPPESRPFLFWSVFHEAGVFSRR